MDNEGGVDFWLGDFFVFPLNFYQISFSKFFERLAKKQEKTLPVWFHVTLKSAVVDPPPLSHNLVK